MLYAEGDWRKIKTQSSSGFTAVFLVTKNSSVRVLYCINIYPEVLMIDPALRYLFPSQDEIVKMVQTKLSQECLPEVVSHVIDRLANICGDTIQSKRDVESEALNILITHLRNIKLPVFDQDQLALTNRITEAFIQAASLQSRL